MIQKMEKGKSKKTATRSNANNKKSAKIVIILIIVLLVILIFLIQRNFNRNDGEVSPGQNNTVDSYVEEIEAGVKINKSTK